ncbi:MAG: CPBP family intramembrane metalloprotease [Thiomicrospira sp.]|uniref:CPBP family glutamic-type intramembrane protease n=1 Tax=Thiomicrospira sp. TaxID=935 RepID=UPI001A078C39|nr:CPBP family glutamic-type intramembrane protease [Thiomicrospira sp.]MBE0494715.1 CPBP family intramembrane metalloprotease [Thiomicrospira sp.]
MAKSNSIYFLIFSIIGLGLAKAFTGFHLDFGDYYLDVERAVFLIAVIVTFYFYSGSVSKLGQHAVLLFILLGLSVLAGLVLQLDPVRAAVAFVMTALVEEILLRAALFEPLIKRGIKSWKIILGTALFFTLVHPAIYSDYLYGVMVLVTGILLGAIYLNVRQKVGIAYGVLWTSAAHTGVIILGWKLNII